MKFNRLFTSIVVGVVVVGLAVGGVGAQSAEEDDLFTMLEEMVPTYNENADSVDLGPVNLAGTSNIYIEDGDETRTYAVTMDKSNAITSLQQGTSDAAVRKITTDRATIEGITSADNPAAAFRDAVANDDIVIAGERGHPVEGIKWAVINVLKGFLI